MRRSTQTWPPHLTRIPPCGAPSPLREEDSRGKMDMCGSGEGRVEGALEMILTNVIQVGKVLISIVYGVL